MRRSSPLPGRASASTWRMSPPTGVQASPVATPTRSWRSCSSGRNLTGPRRRSAAFGVTVTRAVAALGHADRDLAADRADLPLEVAQPGLARVAVDEEVQPGVEEAHLAGLEPVLGELLRDQVPARDLDLLLLGVAGERDDLHAVEERGLDGLGHVGGRDEQDFREVVGDVQVVVAERVVLLGVEDLEQRRRGVAAVVGADLVDLVEHEHRVRRPGLVDPLDDATGERAHVRSPVAADLGLVVDAAERDPDELALEGARDRASERGLADARRSDEAEDRPLAVLLELAHREELDDALLDLLEVVVVVVEDAAGVREVEVVARERLPREAGEPVEVGADDGRLGGVGVGACACA